WSILMFLHMSASDADHRARALRAGSALGCDELVGGRVARPLAAEARLDDALEVGVARARAHRAAQIELAFVEQAPAEVAVRREADAVARPAERLGHRGDDADAP